MSGAASVVAVLGVGASLLATPAYAEPNCPNGAIRAEQGEPGRALPDCRAYERVSPSGLQFASRFNDSGFRASLNGERIASYSTFGAPPGSTFAGPSFLSSRGPGGWSTKDMVPRQSRMERLCYPAIQYSPDLSRSVLLDGWNWEGYPRYPDDNGQVNDCGHDEPLLVPGEPQGAQNLFLHDNEAPTEAGFYQLLNPTPSGLAARDAWFWGASTDFSHIVFTSPNQLTPDAPSFPPKIMEEWYGPGRGAGALHVVAEDLYEWAAGTLRPLTVLPDGVPAWGLLANGGESGTLDNSSSSWTHAVSADGERAVFYAGGEISWSRYFSLVPLYTGGGLYLRLNAAQQQSHVSGGATDGSQCTEAARACTVQLDAAQPGAEGPSGGGKFQWASADGSRIFFTDCNRLTAGSTAVPAAECGQVKGLPKEPVPAVDKEYAPTGNDLYEYNLEKPPGERLTDLTPDHNGFDPLAADVQGLAGVSEDGSHVYFVAKGVLAANTVENGAGPESASAGRPNLYLRHGGATTFIASLESTAEYANRRSFSGASAVDACDWANSAYTGQLRAAGNCMSSSMSARVSPDGRFLAFNSFRSLTGYDNTVAEPNRSGETELSHEIFRYDAAREKLSCASCDPAGEPPTAIAEHGEDPRIEVPVENENWQQGPTWLTHQLSEDGRVFFTTTDALLPADVNKVQDVYEWEPEGVGGCSEAGPNFSAASGGCLRLISTGASPDPSFFRDAGASGNDVFFFTTQGLVRSDTDRAISLYDARVGGGFQEPPESPVCESEEACHPERQQPPPVSSSGSSRFEGREEGPKHLICPKGQVKRHGHCVKPRRHHKKRHHRRANLNRGGAK